MRIGINILYLLPEIARGTGTYALALLQSLAEIDSSNHYFVFTNREGRSLSLSKQPNFHHIVCPVPGKYRALRYAWEQLVLPLQLRHYNIDVLHSLGYVGPVHSSSAHVLTIHDLNFLELKRNFPILKRVFFRLFSTASARTADRVLAVSEFSREQMITSLKLPPEKVEVVHSGPGLLDLADIADAREVKEQYSLPEQYVAAFGRRKPHKNLQRLVEGFAQIADVVPHTLVLIGDMPGNMLQFSTPAIMNRVRRLGELPANHVLAVLQGADLFILPSLYEGFGLPVLEAQAVGVAVACSNAASLPEIAGEGALYFDPRSADSISSAILKSLSDQSLRDALVKKGHENLRRFSWEATARATLALYRSVYESR